MQPCARSNPAALERQRALSTARAVLADPPGEPDALLDDALLDDALLDAARLLATLSPDLSEREGATAPALHMARIAMTGSALVCSTRNATVGGTISMQAVGVGSSRITWVWHCTVTGSTSRHTVATSRIIVGRFPSCGRQDRRSIPPMRAAPH